MSLLFLFEAIFMFVLLALFIFYALIFASIRRAQRASALPIPKIWKFVLVLNAGIFVVSILIVLLF